MHMGFIRSFDSSKIKKLSDASAELFAKLKNDTYAGLVFPAVRKGEVHFYYKGGCLYKFNGISFARDKAYGAYSDRTDGLDEYAKAKRQNENKFTNTGGSAKERQLLDRLNSHTFNRERKTKTVVLDMEIRLNGTVGENKKCDMVLLNTETRQIMFVEGKVFSDNRVNRTVGNRPEVIEQVNIYTAGLAEQAQAIELQYAEHISIINALFGTTYEVNNCLVTTAKLLVYETPKNPNDNGRYSIDAINAALGAENVMWVASGEEPGIDEIWDALTKGCQCK
jgi:hypothetical protein